MGKYFSLCLFSYELFYNYITGLDISLKVSFLIPKYNFSIKLFLSRNFDFLLSFVAEGVKKKKTFRNVLRFHFSLIHFQVWLYI
jgi:hypothetical protein